MERRTVLKAAASSALAGAAGLGVTQSGDAADAPQSSGSTTITGKKFRMNRPYRVIVNEDGGRGGRNYVAPLTAEQYLRAVFEVQAENKPVDALFWCGLQNPAGGTWYNTKVGEVGGSMFWPQVKEAWEWGPMKTRDELMKQGLDPLTLVCDRGHELGKDIWLSFRANDTHHVWNRQYVGSKMTRKYKQRDDLCVGPDHGRKSHVTFAPFQWDYHKQEVRDFVLELLTEAYMDYDIDGLELDFMRVAFLFAKKNTKEGTKLMNGFMRKVREIADRAEQRKGRPQGIAVRLPSYEPACAEGGYDWRTWVEEGLIDVLTASTHQPAEQEADLSPFVEGCRDTGTLVTFCLESAPSVPHVHYDRAMVHIHGATPNGLSTENFRSMALGAYQQGADAVYFFNLHFPFERFDTHPNLEFLTEMHDRELMAERDQTYLVNYEPEKYAHHWFFECAPPRPLPHWITREEPEYSFDLTIGSDLEEAVASNRLRAAKLRICTENMTPPDVIEVLWNGEPLEGEFEPPIEPGTWQHWFGVHFWIADLAKLGRAPKPGKHKITVRLKHRNPEIGEGIVLKTAEFDVRFWHKPGMPHAVNELPGMFR